MSAFQWKLFGSGVLAMLAFIGASCALDGHPLRQCMRGNVMAALGTGLLLGACAAGAWLGHETWLRTGRAWAGWIAGIAVGLGLAMLLGWLRLLP